ncbi:hypothetical protein VOI54_06985 [Tamlana sp. 2201CG12-4]|uniref:hypothetical protein n=1 Tax=Tamlana sp. 2201CG12-4 TaxID=3112582 RepID=UPI002DB5BAB5|nr:hypothetical protein [Tamlana sp. 2201CG12-4]MEC3906757.1 hypothetical protein [Tamlana sp. 2201CG12-4]
MKTSIKYIIASLVLSLYLFNCSSSGGGDDAPEPKPPAGTDPPGAAALVFPNENSECTEGSNLTSTQSTIVFNWNDANNTDTYQLVVKNLETQAVTNYTSTVSEKSVTILRGTPYSWYVVSKNSGSKTAQSATWKFYNAGEAVSSYAPFPADLISPIYDKTFSASTTSVTLEWTGEDVDDDIKEYKVLFGTASTPTNEQGITASSTLDVNVSSGNSYYWRVISVDDQNNTSESQIFKFNIE